MSIYIFAAVLSVTFAAIAERIRSGPGRGLTYRFFCLFSYLPLAVLAALRFRTGTDWWIYDAFFRSINHGGESFSEEGFNLLNKIVYFFNGDITALTAILAFITCLFVFMGIFAGSVNASLSVLIYIISADYFNSLNQLRQALAMAIFLYALRFIRERKIVAYFIWIVVASTIHFGAIFLLSLYFVYGLHVNLKVHIVVMSTFVLLIPVASNILIAIVKMTRYSWYVGSYYDSGNFYLSGFLLSFAILILYDAIYLSNKSNANAEFFFYANISLIPVILLMYTAYVPQILRLSTMFATVNCLGIPILVSTEKNRAKRMLLCVFLICLYIAKLLYDVYANDWYGILPYHNIFSGRPAMLQGHP